MILTETKTHYKITGTSECEYCSGTGLYQGMAERDSAFVVCRTCDGSGKVQLNLTFKKFTKRKKQPNCKRVYKNSMGFVITDKDVKDKKGSLLPFSKYGCSYSEWLNGEIPKHLEFLGCPYLATNQSLQRKDKNCLYKTRCNYWVGLWLHWSRNTAPPPDRGASH